VKESAVLELLMGECTMIVSRANGPHVIDIMVGEGTMIPAHVSAGGKAILAFSSVEIINELLRKPLPRLTSKTTVDPKELKRQFKEIRRTGISMAPGEYNIDVHAVGAPIFNKDRDPLAGIVITMSAFRAPRHDLDELAAL
jgi:IclR family transcriptional regulator, acetate operon repressor